MKRLAFYPFLFLLNIVLLPLAHNLNQLHPALVLRSLVILFLAAAGGLWLIHFLTKDWQYAAYLVFLLSFFSFAFGHLVRFIQDLFANFGLRLIEPVFLLICTMILGILAVKKVWRRLGGQTWMRQYLNLAFALGLLAPGIELAQNWMEEYWHRQGAAERVQTTIGEITIECADMPDIYYLILDGYGRGDMLQELYGFDNQPFLEYLAGKGFYIATESATNYIQTYFSIPSSLNFSFIVPPSGGVKGRLYMAGLIEHNNITAVLKRCGYQTISFESGFSLTEQPEVDLYLRGGIGSNEFEDLLLADSPIDILANQLNLQLPGYGFEAHRQRVLFSFEKLKTLPEMDGPKFVFAHIISPHPPFVFDRNGKALNPRRTYYLGDGEDYQGSPSEYLHGYPEQVRFVNQKLQQVIDAILANSLTPPVIILQGDHGPGNYLLWDSPEQTCLFERTSILNAYYFPDEDYSLLHPTISPVNSFRVVLNRFFSAGLPLLPDSTYFSFHKLEFKPVDVTAERSSRAHCGLP